MDSALAVVLIVFMLPKTRVTVTIPEPTNLTLASGVGDSVEIWDVRRGWIAKWSVTGSAGDGGVSGKRAIFFP